MVANDKLETFKQRLWTQTTFKYCIHVQMVREAEAVYLSSLIGRSQH
jgi:hypothetical protein